MFHMSKEMFDTVQKLAELIAASEELAAMKNAEKEAENDPELTVRVAEYVTARSKLDDESVKESPDAGLIADLTRESEEAEKALRSTSSYIRSEQCRTDFNAMMQAISDILQNAIHPGSAGGCTGDCASCSGCKAE